MSEPADLQAEVERLRAEVASYQQRELADLKFALAAAREECAAWKSEARRINAAAIELDSEYRNQISRLQGQLETQRMQTRNQRSVVLESRN